MVSPLSLADINLYLVSAPGRIQTNTEQGLNLLPLPIGLQGQLVRMEGLEPPEPGF